MNADYSKIEEITSSKVDVNHNIRYDTILNIFQDLATAHATQMGMSFTALKENCNAFWVLSKIRFLLKGSIRQFDVLTSKTWPLKPTAFRFNRDFILHGNSGEVLGSSEWCVLDIDSGRLRQFSSLNYPNDLQHLTARSNAGEFNKFFIEISESDLIYTYTAQFCDIDCNGHVNNVSYGKMALNVFTPKEFVNYNFTGFEIHFISQTYFGNQIKIYKKQLENGVYVEGRLNDKAVFKAKFEY